MTPVFERVCVIGLGLLGGSVALAARSSGAVRRAVGSARRQAALDAALRAGVIEAGDTDPVRAVDGADLVVLATPVSAMPDLVRRIGPKLSPGCVVTDVGSVKCWLVENLPGLLPRGVSYVGSHPMAGSHEQGLDAAHAELFAGAACVVTDADDGDAHQRICDFWSALGARVVRRSAAAHDDEVAWVSHVPHALAFAFAAAFATAPPGAREVVGAGFRDFTRIAQSAPELWSEILAANQKALSAPLQEVAESLAALARSIEAGDADATFRIVSRAGMALQPASPRNAAPETTREVHASPDTFQVTRDVHESPRTTTPVRGSSGAGEPENNV